MTVKEKKTPGANLPMSAADALRLYASMLRIRRFETAYILDALARNRRHFLSQAGRA